MIIVIYRKTDAMPLLKLGQGPSSVIAQLNQLAQMLTTTPSKTACAKLDAQVVTYLSSDKFIFVVVDDVQQQKLVRAVEETFSMSFSLKVANASHEFQFQSFEPNIEELLAKQNAQSALELLNTETEEVKQIVQVNLEQILKRGASLNKMEDDSVALVDGTKQILADAKELDLAAFWRRYAIWIVIGGIAFLWLVLKLL